MKLGIKLCYFCAGGEAMAAVVFALLGSGMMIIALILAYASWQVAEYRVKSGV